MLKSPECGWSKISIGNWSDRCSYLDDVPVNLVRAIDKTMRKSAPQSVLFDAEGYEYIIVFGCFETHIITENDDGWELTTIETSLRTLAKEIISDVRRDLLGWVEWQSYRHMSEKEKEDRARYLIALCEALDRRIEGKGGRKVKNTALYKIVAIKPKDPGYSNQVHSEALGARARIDYLHVGERGWLEYYPRDGDDYHYLHTSTVMSFTPYDNGEKQIEIETERTVYTLEREDG